MEEKLRNFVKPYYDKKDEMHDLNHIQRVLNKAKEIGDNYNIDNDVLKFGCYLHGIIEDNRSEAEQFLKDQKISEEKKKKIMKAAEGSLKQNKPETIEGRILHDAHLLEGGETFHIIKSLIAGKERGQTFKESIKYLEENIIGQYSCSLPENQKEYRKKEEFAKAFIEKVEKEVDLS
ncbi:MAG: HD domain-containing protein [Candidatus Nanohaloarchaea archaeon]